MHRIICFHYCLRDLVHIRNDLIWVKNTVSADAAFHMFHCFELGPGYLLRNTSYQSVESIKHRALLGKGSELDILYHPTGQPHRQLANPSSFLQDGFHVQKSSNFRPNQTINKEYEQKGQFSGIQGFLS